MKIKIEKIVYPGKSLARQEGKVILTDEGLPGEEIEIDIVKDRKDYVEAKTLRILKNSVHRREPRCDHYKACSRYQYIDYSYQAEIKKAQTEEIFLRALKKKPENMAFKTSPEIWGYRNKIDFNLIWEKENPSLAYNAPGLHNRFIKVNRCFLASEKTNDLLNACLELLKSARLNSVTRVVVRENAAKNGMFVLFYGKRRLEESRLEHDFASLTKAFPVKGIVSIPDKAPRNRAAWGEDSIREKIDNMTLEIGPESFFQINVPVLGELIKDINGLLSLSGTETIADLYCGVGTFGMALAPKTRRVIGVESSSENTAFLKRNLELNTIRNFDVYEGSCEAWIADSAKEAVDAVILDPPRQGISAEVREYVLKNRPRQVLYISCNPSTLTRDIGAFFDVYDLKALWVYDFFPQTPHIEIVAFLSKK